VTDAPRRPRPQLRRTILALAALTIVLFAGGIVYGYEHRNDRPCGKQNPVKERPGMLGQTEYLCPDGRTVTD
jgi:hypothetical protein